MNTSEEQEIKKEFQLERVILFSDAVFAIIITIMVIELKLPESIREMKLPEVQHAFKGVTFKFIGYLVTFFLVARFWIVHLKIFSFLKDYNTKLLALNLFFLFCVSLFPFAVTLITGAFHVDRPEYAWGINTYITVFFLSTLAQCFLIAYMIKNKEKLCFSTDTIETVLKWKMVKITMVLIPVFFMILGVCNYLGLNPIFYIYIIALFGLATGRLIKKFYPSAPSEDKPFILRMFAGRQKKSRQAEIPPGS